MHRTGTSRAEQAAGAATPRTGAAEDKWRPDAPDWIVWGRPRNRNCRPPDWSIRGGTSSRHHGELRRGHEDEAVEMQRSIVEDEAGEKQRRQDEDKAKVTQ